MKVNFKFITFTLLLCLIGQGAIAQNWSWTGEVARPNEPMYIYNPAPKAFITKTGLGSLDDATPWILTSTESTNIKSEDGTTFINDGVFGTSSTRNNWKFESWKSDNEGKWYNIKYTSSSRNTYYLRSKNDTQIEQNNTTSNRRDWFMISKAQVEDYNTRKAAVDDLNFANASEANPVDVTAYIKNANINQTNGANNVMPFGWIAFTHGSGNGTYTLGTGDTKLECWHGTAASFDVDYYQTVKVPAGKYRLSADMHFCGTENAVGVYAYLDGETHSTPVNVNDETDRTYSVEFTVNALKDVNIGVKKIGENTADNAWITADNFRLEFLGNTFGDDLTDKMGTAQSDWEGATGMYSTNYPERYNGDNNPYEEGEILTQTIKGLIAGKCYELEFYAVANVARNLDKDLYSGSGIAYIFANETQQDIDVLYQDACTPTNYLRTLIAKADANGEIKYGIANHKAGGQWYVAQAKSLKYLGEYATMAVNSTAKYGTFCAPFDVTIPAGVSAYTVSGVSGNALVLNEVTTTIPANTPVILNAEEGLEATTFYGMAVNGTPTAGLLVGTYTQIDAPVGSYILYSGDSGVGFYRVGNSYAEGKQPKVSANRCYLTAPTQSAKMFSIGDSGATAIETVTALTEGKIKNIYNVNAAVRGGLQQGVNIVTLSNGKTVKVIVK